MIEFFKKLGMPEVAAAHGDKLDGMLSIVHWFMLVLFVGWGVFYIYTLIRFRASKNPTASYKGVTGHTSSYAEVAVVIFEVFLLLGFAVPLWAERVNEFPNDQETIIVRVVAEQFAWNIHYPGADGVFGKTDISLINKETNPLGLDRKDPNALDDITNINQLHLPVGKPAIIRLSSKDVIHSFGVPEMRVKQDAIPGMEIPLWFTPTVTTEEMRARKGNPKFRYEIACAQLCGLGHYRMRGFVTIDSSEEFGAWLGNQEPTLGAGGSEEDEFWG